MQISWFRNDYNISKQKKMEASQIQKVKQGYQSDRNKAIATEFYIFIEVIITKVLRNFLH